MTEDAGVAPWKSPSSINYGDERAVLLIADRPDDIRLMREAASGAGCRVSGVLGLDEAAAGIERQIAVDAVALTLSGDESSLPCNLLDRLDSAARSGRHGSVVSAPAGLIDAVAARVAHRDVHQLADPSALDWIEALAAASARGRLRLNDITKERSSPRLQQLSEEVGRIANILASLSDDDEAPPPEGASAEARAGGRRIEAGHIRAIIRARRMRDHYFKSDLFADPAWDMLLDLMAAKLEDQKVAVSSLCIAAAVPPTTALRWIKTLSEQGLFVRVADVEDGRRVFIELSDRAAADLEAYLNSAQRISPMIL